MPDYQGKELIFYLISMVSVILVSIPVSVLIHETGHLLGGLLSGYKLIFMLMGGLLMVSKRFATTLNRDSVHKGVGQCLMYSENCGTRPYLLILGGCILNLTVSLISIPMAFSGGLARLVILFPFGAVNLSLALSNFFGSSCYCDGRAFRECVLSAQDMIAYNNILMISRYLAEGDALSEIPEWYFGTCSGFLNSALSAEMEFYSYKRKAAALSGAEMDSKEYLNLFSRLDRLKKYDKNTGIGDWILLEEQLLQKAVDSGELRKGSEAEWIR